MLAAFYLKLALLCIACLVFQKASTFLNKIGCIKLVAAIITKTPDKLLYLPLFLQQKHFSP
ncbi:hypothetical protein C7N43_14010 [Sphingobacteriales bacterium UPWRP_1]|nr:hypothetical protein B6N25_10125 [Sphingobacteriales bacterium TSM_CSS]PSJ76412.1 hypothetical protein C7N43_14010 [Sphingobacteriales bacterium UPWRP_1]